MHMYISLVIRAVLEHTVISIDLFCIFAYLSFSTLI